MSGISAMRPTDINGFLRWVEHNAITRWAQFSVPFYLHMAGTVCMLDTKYVEHKSFMINMIIPGNGKVRLGVLVLFEENTRHVGHRLATLQ